MSRGKEEKKKKRKRSPLWQRVWIRRFPWNKLPPPPAPPASCLAAPRQLHRGGHGAEGGLDFFMVLPRSWSWARRPVASCKYLPQELGAEVWAGNPSLGTGRLRGRGWRAAPLHPSTGKPIFFMERAVGTCGVCPLPAQEGAAGSPWLWGSRSRCRGGGEEAGAAVAARCWLSCRIRDCPRGSV